MSSPIGRFRAWLASVEFAVTATAILVALVASALAFRYAGDTTDGYFVLVLAGIGVPNIYENQWPTAYDSRAAGAAWSLVASVALLACYALVVTVLRSVAAGFAPSAAAFVVAWLLGIVAARLRSGDAE